MKTNKLSVNINKKNYVIFSSKQKTTKINLPVLFDDKPLKRVNVVQIKSNQIYFSHKKIISHKRKNKYALYLAR
jgi:hypothetical protein